MDISFKKMGEFVSMELIVMTSPHINVHPPVHNRDREGFSSIPV